MSGADALAAAAAAGESGKKMKAPKVYAAKADEAGEALKAKPAKVRRLEESKQHTRERRVFFFPVPFVARRNFSSPLFFPFLSPLLLLLLLLFPTSQTGPR